jgi:hypothetical protein
MPPMGGAVDRLECHTMMCLKHFISAGAAAIRPERERRGDVDNRRLRHNFL